MQLFDTHGHLNLKPLYNQWEDQLQKTQKHQVHNIFVPGTNLRTSRIAIELASASERVLAGIGIHPNEAENVDIPEQITKLKALFDKNRTLITGIGETGLDYYRLKDNKTDIIQKQKVLFTAQLKLAVTHRLPVSIHVRDKNIPSTPTENNAYWDALSIIKEHHQSDSPLILHCASGPVAYIQEAIDLGAYISFAGNVTYPNATNIQKILEIVPNDQLLVETDAPYLPPQDFRGKICELWMISKTAEYITTHKEITRQKLKSNAETVFNLL